MKNLIFIFTFCVFAFCSSAQIINFPDPNLKANLIAAGGDQNADGEIDMQEALDITIYESENPVTDFSGFEHLINLEEISIYRSNWKGQSVSDFDSLRIFKIESKFLHETISSEYRIHSIFLDCRILKVLR